MTYLISACLLGCACRYDGKSRPIPKEISALAEHHTLIPVCPEILGGLPTPRPPAEIRGGRVINREETDVTDEYRRGAEEVLRLFHLLSADGVILKDMSPSCGTDGIYDGSFCRRKIAGEGITAALLRKAGVPVFGESGPPADARTVHDGGDRKK